jgi:hypothetical protein
MYITPPNFEGRPPAPTGSSPPPPPATTTTKQPAPLALLPTEKSAGSEPLFNPTPVDFGPPPSEAPARARDSRF